MSDTDKPTLDDAVDAAWDKVTGAESETQSTTGDVPEPAQTATAPTDGQPPAATDETTAGTQPPASGDASRTRDDKGRFQKGAETKAPTQSKTVEKVVKPTTTQTQPPASGDGKELRPPPSLSPQAREAWGNVPKEVQAEIWRRERETAQEMRASSEARQHQQWFQQAVGPYEPYFRAEGVDSRTGLTNMLQTLAVLHGPNVAQKHMLWATVAKTYGLDPDMLSQAYNGTLQPNTGAPSQAGYDPRTIAREAARLAREEMNGERLQVVQQHAVAEVQKHAETLEFMNDLRPQMAAIIDGFTAAKQAIDIPTAYRLALETRPDLTAILKQREAAKAAAQPNPALLRARAAGSSIRGTPAPPRPPADRRPGLDGAVDAAWDSVVNRRGAV